MRYRYAEISVGKGPLCRGTPVLTLFNWNPEINSQSINFKLYLANFSLFLYKLLQTVFVYFPNFN